MPGIIALRLGFELASVVVFLSGAWEIASMCKDTSLCQVFDARAADLHRRERRAHRCNHIRDDGQLSQCSHPWEWTNVPHAVLQRADPEERNDVEVLRP